MEAVVDTITELTGHLTEEDIIFLSLGAALFAWWAMKAIRRRDPLADVSPRRNDLPPYTPLIPFFIWLCSPVAAFALNDTVLADIQDWQKAAVINLCVLIAGLVGIAVMVAIARRHFARGLKGLGLKAGAIPKDIVWAFINLVSIAPVFSAAFVLTLIVARVLVGAGWEMPKHEELEMITEYSELPLRVLLIVTAVGVAPVFEELLFRGFVQTMILSYLRKPWLSIVVASAIFAAAHANPTHWPALFVLSMCMGYSYEKSGSLFRPIFVHALFNGTSVLATLYGQ
jgi:membrane protease YdiL (CAAX protease family)